MVKDTFRARLHSVLSGQVWPQSVVGDPLIESYRPQVYRSRFETPMLVYAPLTEQSAMNETRLSVSPKQGLRFACPLQET